MKKKLLVGMVLGASTLMSYSTYAQEEESAEVYLEEYTDEFQENFFEGLKQKGIQNYDRAIDLFLKCKQLEPDNSVVDYELAKAYLQDKKYIQAQQYAVEALLSEPTDYWYLDNLLTILDKQGSPWTSIKEQIPYENDKLRENMAVSFFKMKKYEEALAVLKEIDNAPLTSELTRKINDSLQKSTQEPTTPMEEKHIADRNDPVTALRTQIEELLSRSDYEGMLAVSKEALDSYPLQPYFYFAYGTALNNTGDSNKAIEVLESGLDYLLDDGPLESSIFRELSKAYTKIGNTQKANEYLNKINSGL
ncbi:tetratricopeptide repeat protein [Flagellimonas sp.]|uniref:tetratricopeptide repeat protein n=1 Tax=Flagellimonas sp. TaxID=2058762 RepID=UPI003AB7018A